MKKNLLSLGETVAIVAQPVPSNGSITLVPGSNRYNVVFESKYQNIRGLKSLANTSQVSRNITCIEKLPI